MIEKPALKSKTPIYWFLPMGVLQGFLLYLSHEYGETFFSTKSIDIAVFIFLFSAPISAYLCVIPNKPKSGIIFSAAMAGIISLLALITFSYLEVQGSIPDLARAAFSVSKALMFYILLAFFQTWQETGNYNFPYPYLFRFSWNNILTLAISGAFAGIAYGVFWLWGILFELIQIEFFYNLFTEAWFVWSSMFGLGALGIAFLREQEKLLLNVRKIIIVFSKFLALFLGAVAILFLVVLPFAGLELLWEIDHTSVTLLAIVTLAVFFINAVIQDSEHLNELANWQHAILMGVNLTLPFYAGLAFYGLFVRVAQYGLTPARIFGWVVIIGALLPALGYAFAVLKGRIRWADWVVKMNPKIALAVVVLAFVIHIPPLNPYGISANNQYQRLKDGKVAADAFDYGLLQYEMGAPGRAAIQKILNDRQIPKWETVKEEIETLNAFNNYYTWKNSRDRLREVETNSRLRNLVKNFHTFTSVFPEGEAVTEDFKKFFVGAYTWYVNQCRDMAPERCGFYVFDFDQDGENDVLFFTTNTPAQIEVLSYQEDGWREILTLYSRKKITWEQFTSGEFVLVEPVLKDLEVDGVKFEKNSLTPYK